MYYLVLFIYALSLNNVFNYLVFNNVNEVSCKYNVRYNDVH